jgi:hypothetical protein
MLNKMKQIPSPEKETTHSTNFNTTTTWNHGCGFVLFRIVSIRLIASPILLALL